MNASEFRFGFRALGRGAERKLTDGKMAFKAHIEADPKAMTADECYLSHFQFPDAFRAFLEMTGSTKGYDGPTYAEWLAFDFDHEHDIGIALAQARRLAAWILDEFKLESDDLMYFFSGSKGFHVLLPTSLWNGQPSRLFHEYARLFAEVLATHAAVKHDESIYSRVNLLRAPNSRHRKTGLYKVQVWYDELLSLRPESMIEMAAEPREGWIPSPAVANPEAAQCWSDVVKSVDHMDTESSSRRASNDVAKLNPTTKALLLGDISRPGNRHRELFSAAANMAEFSSLEELVTAVLTPYGINSGLSAVDVRRQIECGMNHVRKHHGK